MAKPLSLILNTKKGTILNIICLITFIFLLPVVYFGSTTPLTSQSIPGNIDAWFNLYILEHGYQNFIYSNGIISKFNDWMNPDFFYPIRRVLPWSDNWLILGLPYNLFRLLFNQVISYKLVLFLSIIANFFALRKLVFFGSDNKLLVNFISFVFLCSFTVLARIGHSQLTAQFFGLLSVYNLLLLINDNHKKSENYADKSLYRSVLFLILQVLTSFYTGIFYVVIWTLLAISVSFIRLKFKFENLISKTKSLFKNFLTLPRIISLLSLLTLLIFNYIPYYIRSKEKGLRDWDTVYDSLIQIPTFFYSKVGGLFTENLSPLSIDAFGSNRIPWEHSGYPGLVQFSLILLGFSLLIIRFICRREFSPHEVILASICFSIVVMVILCSKFIIFEKNIDPWFLFWKYLPGFGAIRVVTRSTSVLVLLAAPIAAYAFERVFNIFKKKYQITFTSFILVIVLFTSIPINRDFEMTSIFFDRVDQLSDKVLSNDCSVFFNQAQPGVTYDPWRSQLVGMWASLMLMCLLSVDIVDFPINWSPYVRKRSARLHR